MGISQSIKTIVSYTNIIDISNSNWGQFNYELDQMEKGQEKDKIIIDIFEEQYWKDRKFYLNHKNRSKRRLQKRNRDIIELKQKLKII